MDDDKALRILLVDDDEDLLDLLKYNFIKDGYRVKTVTKVRNVIATARRFQPQLIILDVLMPDGSGIELCKEIRSLSCFSNTVVFFLSACPEGTFRNITLEVGADDFIEKLSGLRVLTNRVTAVLKNKFIIRKGVSTLSFHDVFINKRSEIVYVRDQQMQLSKPEFEILFFLMQNPNKVVSRKTLVNIIWGSEIFALASPIDNCIESLRRKIGLQVIERISTGHYRFRRRCA